MANKNMPKNKYILSRMNDRSYNVLELPCGWLIIDLSSSKAGYMLIMHSDYNMRLSTNEVFYQAELVNDEGHRWAGLVRFASLDEAMVGLMVGPKNIFLDKGTMAWDHEGRCIHWGPAPFHDIDKMHNDFVKSELERRKKLEAGT